MIYSILLAGLIYVSSGNRLLLQGEVKCCNDAPCNSAQTCSPTYNVCSVGCSGNADTSCSAINSALTCVADGDVNLCLPATIENYDPCPSFSTTDTGETPVCPPPNGISCTTVDDCLAAFECVDGAATLLAAESAVCLDGECTVTCNNGNIVCTGILDPVNGILTSPNQITALECEARDGGLDPVCVVPAPETNPDPTDTTETPETDPESTEAPLDISCVEASDCETLDSSGQLAAGVAALNEAFACVELQCTITCVNDANVCATADGIINSKLGTDFTLTCDTDASPAVCIEASTVSTTEADGLEFSTTDDGDEDCDADICSEERLECNEEGPEGQCSVQFKLSADVCILNRGMNRGEIFENFRGAVEFVINSDGGGVCDGGEIFVTGYACVEKDSPFFELDQTPTADTCPANVDTQCVKVNKANFAVSVDIKVALFCTCDDDDDLVEIRDKLDAALSWAEDFVERVQSLSLVGDKLCNAGFGLVVAADEFSITVHKSDGTLFDTVIDITGGAVQGYFYMAGVFVVVMLAFL